MKKIKTEKPVFVVDATNCKTGADLKLAFITAKAGKEIITTDELDFLVDLTANRVMDVACSVFDTFYSMFHNTLREALAKEPWYKRLWKKLKYAFTW